MNAAEPSEPQPLAPRATPLRWVGLRAGGIVAVTAAAIAGPVLGGGPAGWLVGAAGGLAGLAAMIPVIRRRGGGSGRSSDPDARRRLRGSPEILEALGAIANIGWWEVDLRTRRVRWSDEVCRIHGVEPGHEPEVEEAIAWYTPECRPLVREAVERAVETGEPYDHELDLVARSGEIRRVRGIGLPVMEGGRCVKLWGAFQDVTELSRARRSVEQLQARFAQAADAASDGPWDYVPATGEMWFSDQFAARVGLSREDAETLEPTLESMFGLIHPDDRAATAAAFEAHLERGAPFEVRHRMRVGAGEYRWFRCRARSTRDGSGEVALVSGCITDIHEQHTAESWLNVATRSANVGLWDWDLESGRLAFNDTFYAMLGYGPGELVLTLENWPELCHPDDYLQDQRAMSRHIAGISPQYESEHRILTRSGSWAWVRAVGEVVERREDGSPRRMTGACIDIDTPKRLSIALQRLAGLEVSESERGTMTAISRALADVYGVDYVGVARTFRGEDGHSRARIVGGWHRGEPAEPVSYGLDGTPCADAIGEHFCHIPSGVTACYPDDHMLRAVGAESYAGLRLQNSNGDAIGLMMMVHHAPVRSNLDIEATLRLFGARAAAELERADHEASLREAMREAHAASKAKSDFLANMSHEIRTPMTAILGYGDVLAAEAAAPGSSELAREAARVLRSHASHLMSLINDTLDVSKIEAGQMTVELMATDPAEIIEQTAALMRQRATERGITLTIEHDTALPAAIRSDPTRLRQILLNLVGNAIKFTEVGGVTVRASHDPASQLMKVRVEDTGVGMTPEQRDVVARFEAFTQADYSTSRRFGGTGLGLKISNALANLLGGGLEVESEAGRGSVFTLTIDAEELIDGGERATTLPGSPGGPRVPHCDAPEPLRGVRVLLAEDCIDNQRLIRFHLERAGASVACVGDGQATVDAVVGVAPGERPHVILMDMQMPRLDGYEATRRIRASGIDAPIVALTAHTLTGDARRCLEAGCSAYVPKPIDWDDLIGTARSLAAAAAGGRAVA